VTAERQVVKSSVGVGGLREDAALALVLPPRRRVRRPLEVVDARSHPKVRDNPSIEEHGIVAYLGVPLTTSAGVRLGALCAIDHEPRQWTGRDPRRAEDLAGAAMAEVELRQREPPGRRGGRGAALRGHARLAHPGSATGARCSTTSASSWPPSGPATYALLDLHGMRGVNDTHGQMAGDELLARLARRLESALVGEGHVYRLGGVQLCALLMETGTAAAHVVSTACRALNARDYSVGCRASTVELPREAKSIAAVLRLADARLARYGHVATARA
jgi:diguanylate cyclase (GGDEF)-like protein